MRKNNGFFSNLFRSGYDRSSGSYVCLYGLLYEQTWYRKFDGLTKEINDLDNQVSEIKGSLSRVNGKH